LQSVSAMSLNPGTSAGSTGGGATGDQGNSPNSTSLPIDTVALHQLLRQFFTARGVTLTDPGKSLFFNDRTGLIYVRATEQDLEIIQGLVSALNRTPP
jgi:type II secretory pathway component HofQ